MWYIADIGTYDHGVCFRFQEKNDKAALRRAFSVCKRRFTEKDDVVQLHRCKNRPTRPLAFAGDKTVWDWMNGWLYA